MSEKELEWPSVRMVAYRRLFGRLSATLPRQARSGKRSSGRLRRAFHATRASSSRCASAPVAAGTTAPQIMP
jgi:hypothetical protein